MYNWYLQACYGVDKHTMLRICEQRVNLLYNCLFTLACGSCVLRALPMFAYAAASSTVVPCVVLYDGVC